MSPAVGTADPSLQIAVICTEPAIAIYALTMTRRMPCAQAASTLAPSAPNQQQAHAATTSFTLVVLLQGVPPPPHYNLVCLSMVIVSEDDHDTTRGPFDLSKATTTPYKRDDPTAAGTQLWTKITLPATFKPGKCFFPNALRPCIRKDLAMLPVCSVFASHTDLPPLTALGSCVLQVDA